MADITNRLPTTLNTVKRPLPSDIEEVTSIDLFARAGSRAIQAAEEFTRGQRIYENRQNSQKAAEAKSAKDKASSQGALIAELSLNSHSDVLTAPTEGNQGDLGEVNDFGKQLALLREAKSQGRISNSMFDARVYQVESNIRSKYGDETFLAYREQMRKVKGDRSTLSTFDRQVTAEENEFKQKQEVDEKAYKYGFERLGPIAETMPRAEIISYGRGMMKAEADLDTSSKRLDFVKKNMDIDEQTREFEEVQAKDEALGAIRAGYLLEVDSSLGLLMKAIPAGLSDTATTEFILTKLPELRAGEEAFVLGITRQMEGSGFEASEIEDVIKPRREAFNNMLKTIEDAPTMAKQSLDLIQTKYKLSAAKAMPLYTSLTSLVGQPGALAILERTSPDFMNKLIREFNDNLGTIDPNNSAYSQMGRLSLVLAGQLSANTLPPEQAREAIKDLVNVVPSIAKGLDTADGSVDAFTLSRVKNGISELSVAAAGINPGTGFADISAVSPALIGPDILRAFEKGLQGADSSDWSSIAQTNKKAAAAILQTVVSDPSFRNFGLKYNSMSGRFEVNFKGSAARYNGTGTGPNTSMFTGVPGNWEKRVSLANRALDHLVAFDRILPEQSIGTPKESRAFFATGQLPPSLTKSGDAAKGAKEDVQRAVSDVLQTFSKGVSQFGEQVQSDRPTTFDKMIRQESQGKQLDKDGKPLTSSKGAIGVAQVLPTTGPEAAELAGLEWDEDKFKTDRKYNMALGSAYFDHMNTLFPDDEEKAVAAYNAGPGRVKELVDRLGSNWKTGLPAETKDYLEKVLG